MIALGGIRVVATKLNPQYLGVESVCAGLLCIIFFAHGGAPGEIAPGPQGWWWGRWSRFRFVFPCRCIRSGQFGKRRGAVVGPRGPVRLTAPARPRRPGGAWSWAAPAGRASAWIAVGSNVVRTGRSTPSPRSVGLELERASAVNGPRRRLRAGPGGPGPGWSLLESGWTLH